MLTRVNPKVIFNFQLKTSGPKKDSKMKSTIYLDQLSHSGTDGIDRITFQHSKLQKDTKTILSNFRLSNSKLTKFHNFLLRSRNQLPKLNLKKWPRINIRRGKTIKLLKSPKMTNRVITKSQSKPRWWNKGESRQRLRWGYIRVKTSSFLIFSWIDWGNW